MTAILKLLNLCAGLALLSLAACAQHEAVPSVAQTDTPQSLEPQLQITERLSQSLLRAVNAVVVKRRRHQGWLYMAGYPVNLDGSRIDYRKTPFRHDWAEGYFDDVFVALFRLAPSSEEAQLLEFEFGATDAPFISWQQKYELDAVLFE